MGMYINVKYLCTYLTTRTKHFLKQCSSYIREVGNYNNNNSFSISDTDLEVRRQLSPGSR